MSQLRQPAPVLAVGLISAAALAYEVLLIRVFAMVHWHELVATAISLALLGYGASGTFLALAGPRLMRRFDLAFGANALLFGIAAPVCVNLAQQVAFDPLALAWEPRQLLALAAIFLLLAVPFFAAANCIGLALSTYRRDIPRLYGSDLVGAGLGAVILLAVLTVLHPARALVGVSLLGALAALVAAWPQRGHRLGVAVVATLLVTLGALYARPSVQPAPYKDLARALAVVGAELDHEIVGVAGIVSVVDNPKVPLRTAPGLSLVASALPPAQKAVFVDGDAIGAIADYGAAPGSTAYLHELVSALPYALLEQPRVAVLNAGVGSGVAQALVSGATHVDAVDVNPQLHELVCGRSPPAAAICASPSVRWHVQTPRAFLAVSPDHYDLVTLTATADPSGLDALDVDFDLTREAIGAYLSRLEADGILAIELPSRVPPRLSLRLIATARDALQMRAVAEPGRHIAAIRGWQRVVMLVRPRPFDETDRARVRGFAERLGFDLVWLPGMQPHEANRFQQLAEPMFHRGAAALLDPQAAGAYREASRVRIDVPDDDRPFAHRFSRWSTLWDALRHGDRARLARIDSGLLAATLTLALVTLIGTVLILLPLHALRGRDTGTAGRAPRSRTLAYFTLVGLAFLFIEIAWIQRIELFLGHPVYATTTVLAAFLVFAGAGSLWSQRRPDHRARQLLWTAVLAILVFSLLYLTFLPALLERLSGLPIGARLIIVLVLLAPLAFAMGIPFPLGLRGLVGPGRPLIPWAWGINGCASVVSAASAPLLAAELGFSGLLLLAVAGYLLLPAVHPAGAVQPPGRPV